VQGLDGAVECAVEFGCSEMALANSAWRAVRARRVMPQPRASLRSSWMWSYRVIIVFLLPSQKTGGGRHAGSGRVKDAAGAAQRGAGVPILSRANQDRRA
jgi:hypothetical protein